MKLRMLAFWVMLLALVLLPGAAKAVVDFAGGDGSEIDPWQIATAEQLDAVRNYLGSDHDDKHFILVADIDLDVAPYNTGEGWAPVGAAADENRFFGHFDGAGHTISGLFINRPGEDFIGLFGYAEEASFNNITLLSVNVTGQDNVGALLGRSNAAAFSNLTVHGTVAGRFQTGGVIGVLEQTSTAAGISADIVVIGSGDRTGGLSGFVYTATIADSQVTGQVTGGGDHVGGLVGHLEGRSPEPLSAVIIGSSTNVAVSGADWHTGGLAGYASNAEISNSHAAGMVAGEGGVGGLVGFAEHAAVVTASSASGNVEANDGYTGGLIGYTGEITISSVYATGTVTAGGNNIGGLIGETGGSARISNAYAKGPVSGGNNVGGLVGEIHSGSEISNAYATGLVSGSGLGGGLIGNNNSDAGVVTDSYYNSVTTGQSDTGKGEPRTTEEMKRQATFAEWDFVGTWGLHPEENGGYPFLRWQGFGDPVAVLKVAGQWQLEMIGDFRPSHVSVALDGADLPHVSFHDINDGNLKYAFFDGAEWRITVIEMLGDRPAGSSIAIDNQGMPGIAYYRQELNYARFDGAEWHKEAVTTSAGESGKSPSLAYDDDGLPHIGSISNSGQLLYHRFNGVSWVETIVEDTEHAFNPSLALNSVGNPHISYHYQDTLSGSIKHAWFDGDTWREEHADDDGFVTGWFNALVLDHKDSPHIVYSTQQPVTTEHNIKYVSVAGIEIVDAAAPATQTLGYVDLELDRHGRLHVSYATFPGFATLYYAWRDGDQWITTTIDAREVNHTAIALDSSGYPHIVYAVTTANGEHLLAIASYTTGHDFGEVEVGDEADRTLTFSNSGNMTLELATASIFGADADQFKIVADNCSGRQLSAGTACTMTVAFGPTAEGDFAAELRLPSNDAYSPMRYAMQGISLAVGPKLTIEDPATGEPFSTEPVSAKVGDQVSFVVSGAESPSLVLRRNGEEIGPEGRLLDLGAGAYELHLNRSGLYEVEVSSGVETRTLTIAVYPHVAFVSPRQEIPATAEAAEVQIFLDGPAPYYPVTIPYSTSGDTYLLPESLRSGEFSISAPGGDSDGLTAVLSLEFTESPFSPQELEFQLGTPENALAGRRHSHKMWLEVQPMAPLVDLDLYQQVGADEPRVAAVVQQDRGLGEVRSAVTNLSSGDLSYDWSASDYRLVNQSGDAGKLLFDPAELVPGHYLLELRVTEPVLQLSSTATLVVHVLAACPDADAADGCGVLDSNGSRIADHLELPDATANQARVRAEADEAAETSFGLRLRPGRIAQAVNSGSLLVSAEDIANHGGPGGGAAPMAQDHGFSNRGGYFDFEVTGIISAGQSVSVVLPLAESIPTGAVYRKYNHERGWFTFEEDERNSLWSAARLADGSCPPLNSELYEEGLNDDHGCLLLVIEEGGPNDFDRSANGIASDPGGLAVAAGEEEEAPVPAVGSGSSSCFIATAVYGSPLSPQVMALREFRDRYLLTSAPGRWLVSLYYQYSPPVAAVIAASEPLRLLTALALAPLLLAVNYPLLVMAAMLLVPVVALRRRGRRPGLQ